MSKWRHKADRGIKTDFAGYTKTTPRKLIKETVFRGIFVLLTNKIDFITAVINLVTAIILLYEVLNR